MDAKQVASEFLETKRAAWGPSVVDYIVTKGVRGLTEEFANDPDLSKLCGWFAKPADDVLAGAVSEFLRLQYPLFGEAVSILTQSLINACAQRHQLNKQAAQANMTVGTGAAVLLLAALVASRHKGGKGG